MRHSPKLPPLISLAGICTHEESRADGLQYQEAIWRAPQRKGGLLALEREAQLSDDLVRCVGAGLRLAQLPSAALPRARRRPLLRFRLLKCACFGEAT